MSKSAGSSGTARPNPAATIVLLRDGAEKPEVFMVRRHPDMAFMGGAHVFPGGRVDASDRDAPTDLWCDGLVEAARRFPDLPPPEAVAHHVGAARELFEEAGVLLARNAAGDFAASGKAGDGAANDRRSVHRGDTSLSSVVQRRGLRLALDALTPFAHWVTPPIDVRRFDTRFFAARMPPAQRAVHDDSETTEGLWMAPADALARCARGEIVLPPPTWTTLREIEPFESVEAAMAWARSRRIVRREPSLVERDGVKTLLIPGAGLPPSAETRFVLVRGRWRAEAART